MAGQHGRLLCRKRARTPANKKVLCGVVGVQERLTSWLHLGCDADCSAGVKAGVEGVGGGVCPRNQV